MWSKDEVANGAMDGNEELSATLIVGFATAAMTLSFVVFLTVAAGGSSALSSEGAQFPQQAGIDMTTERWSFEGQQALQAAAAGPARRARARTATKAARRLSIERQFGTTRQGGPRFHALRAARPLACPGSLTVISPSPG